MEIHKKLFKVLLQYRILNMINATLKQMYKDVTALREWPNYLVSIENGLAQDELENQEGEIKYQDICAIVIWDLDKNLLFTNYQHTSLTAILLTDPQTKEWIKNIYSQSHFSGLGFNVSYGYFMSRKHKVPADNWMSLYGKCRKEQVKDSYGQAWRYYQISWIYQAFFNLFPIHQIWSQYKIKILIKNWIGIDFKHHQYQWVITTQDVSDSSNLAALIGEMICHHNQCVNMISLANFQNLKISDASYLLVMPQSNSLLLTKIKHHLTNRRCELKGIIYLSFYGDSSTLVKDAMDKDEISSINLGLLK